MVHNLKGIKIMEKKKLMGKGLRRLLIVTGVVLLLYIISFIAFAFLVRSSGDPELGGFKAILRYFLKDGVLNLCIFNFGSKIYHFALSIFLYALLFCWIIFLIAGIVVMDKKERKVIWWGIILTLVNLGIYALFAAGSRKYWQIINGGSPYEANLPIFFVTIVVLLLGVIFFVLSLGAYFWSIVDAFLKPGKGARKEVFADVDDEDYIRNIVRDELIKNQPFKVIIVGNETVKEEPALEKEPEEVKEEVEEIVEQAEEPVVEAKEQPKVEEKKLVPTVKFWDAAKEVFPSLDNPHPIITKKEENKIVKQPSNKKEVIYINKVSFWDAAREVWPQLENPRPLPKEEKPAEPIETEDDGWNRNKRQPFMVRIITADLDTKANYNEIKNELLSYGVKSRVSRGGDTFRLGGKEYAKIYLVGKTLKVYFALSPEDYKDSTFPIEDVGHRPNYAGMPLLFKVRSKLSVRRCKDLIKDAMSKDELTQKEVKNTNWVDELRKLNAEKAKKK